MWAFRDIIAKCLVGVGAPSMGIIVSSLSELEAWLRVASLLMGLLVGGATFVSIVKKIKKKD